MRSVEKTDTDLSEHLFLKQLLEDSRPLIASPYCVERLTRNGLKKRRTESDLPEPFAYIHGCFHNAVTLMRIADRLDQIRFFMRCFPARKQFELRGITQDKWIQYHYANFVVTYASAYDTSLILTNYIFRLGIQCRHCNTKTVRENLWVGATTVKPALKNIEEIIKPYAQPRHLHVHRGEIPDLEHLDEVELISFINLHTTPSPFPPQILKAVYRGITKDIDASIGKDVLTLRSAIATLFNTLLPVYKSRLLVLPSASTVLLKGR